MEAQRIREAIAEFIGAFMLVFTVGCVAPRIASPSPSDEFAGLAIACVLMVSIYALGPISGAHFNPAVTLSIYLAGKEADVWKVVHYILAQLLAGMVAAHAFGQLVGQMDPLGDTPGVPAWDYNHGQQMMAEGLYTMMLCFVVLNVACADDISIKGNNFFGLAIGFVIVAAAYSAGPISSGCFNPAVVLGVATSSGSWTDLMNFNGSWSVSAHYAVAEFLAAAIAAGLFKAVREYTGLVPMCLAEFLGTFMLVVTVGLNVQHPSIFNVFSIASSLMCMVYALGDVSGANFNPAVSVAIYVSGRNKQRAQYYNHCACLNQSGMYIKTQIFAGLFAGLTYKFLEASSNPNPVALKPLKDDVDKSQIIQIMTAEYVFTFLLTFVVLNVATTKSSFKSVFGLAIGMCVTVGGYSVGSISGGNFNPAVTLAIAVMDWGNSMTSGAAFVYIIAQVLAGITAAGVFRHLRPEEYPVEDKNVVNAQEAMDTRLLVA